MNAPVIMNSGGEYVNTTAKGLWEIHLRALSITHEGVSHKPLAVVF